MPIHPIAQMNNRNKANKGCDNQGIPDVPHSTKTFQKFIVGECKRIERLDQRNNPEKGQKQRQFLFVTQEKVSDKGIYQKIKKH